MGRWTCSQDRRKAAASPREPNEGLPRRNDGTPGAVPVRMTEVQG
ncbi:hypothetical protein STTU_5646 [Streptomyces sp. Tu6071]|nr:hypothetical protein STTU_5646 [Streptomyces sp. Tu6071]